MSENSDPLINPDEYEDPDVCTRQQINRAIMDIEIMHPLRSRAKFDHIIPAFKCFRKCFKAKPEFKRELKNALLKDMGFKLPDRKNQKQTDQNPFLLLGYGINAYFDIMLYLGVLMLLITAFMAPAAYIYSNNSQNAL